MICRYATFTLLLVATLLVGSRDALNVGVGIADVTGPVAEVGFVSNYLLLLINYIYRKVKIVLLCKSSIHSKKCRCPKTRWDIL